MLLFERNIDSMVMLNPAVMTDPGLAAGNGLTETVKSRFGDIVVDTSKSITFPRGLLGMPDKFNFALVGFPSPKMQDFTLLQSMDDPMLSFITLPLALENNIIARKDMHAACQELKIAEANLVTLLMVSVHRTPSEVKLSVNARAPLFVDTARKTGIQFVFLHEGYQVQHMLS